MNTSSPISPKILGGLKLNQCWQISIKPTIQICKLACMAPKVNRFANYQSFLLQCFQSEQLPPESWAAPPPPPPH